MQQGSAADYDVSTTIEGEEGRIVIECMDDGSSFSNFRRFQGRAISPDGTAVDLQVVQTGPGRYEGTFKADERGTYLVNVTAAGTAEQGPTSIRTGVTVAYSPEFKDVTVNEALLREVAEATSGRVLEMNAQPETVFAHNLPPTISRTPIWDTLLKLAVFMFLVDVAVRRIAIDPLKMLARVRSTIGSLAGRFGAGKRAEETLTDLKSVRERVRSEKTAEGDASAIAAAREAAEKRASERAGAPAASTKFDAGAATKKPAEDIVTALGGHKGAGAKPGEAKAPKKKEGPQESTTARLLKAKKRAQQQKEQEDKEQS
jgi:hypothetical protein